MIRLFIIYSIVLVIGYYSYKLFISRKNLLKHKIKEYKELNNIAPELLQAIIKLEDIQPKFDSEIQDSLNSILHLQRNILDYYKNNPQNFPEQARRLIINYTNSLLEILEKYYTLSKKSSQFKEISIQKQKILDLLGSMQSMLSSIENKVLDNQFSNLDSEIQSMKDGLNLDGH
jgi:5-bromo-4-chloroindolyl phosphate hydrolysis protein